MVKHCWEVRYRQQILISSCTVGIEGHQIPQGSPPFSGTTDSPGRVHQARHASPSAKVRYRLDFPIAIVQTNHETLEALQVQLAKLRRWGTITANAATNTDRTELHNAAAPVKGLLGHADHSDVNVVMPKTDWKGDLAYCHSIGTDTLGLHWGTNAATDPDQPGISRELRLRGMPWREQSQALQAQGQGQRRRKMSSLRPGSPFWQEEDKKVQPSVRFTAIPASTACGMGFGSQ